MHSFVDVVVVAVVVVVDVVVAAAVAVAASTGAFGVGVAARSTVVFILIWSFVCSAVIISLIGLLSVVW